MDSNIKIRDLVANYANSLWKKLQNEQVVNNQEQEDRLTEDTWITGKKLEDLLQTNNEQNYKKRYVFDDLMQYLTTPANDVCALYGLRRTGKSVLMRQAIWELMNEKGISSEAIAYITFNRNTEYTDNVLINDITKMNEKVKYFFIDEISYIDMDIENNSLNALADKFTVYGKKIVIAGTFSYAIRLLSKDVLFGRLYRINTTYFSFKEANELTGISLEEFMERGGILIGREELQLSPDEYMETAVIDNIVNSLVRSERLYDIGYLDAEIDKLIDENNNRKLKFELANLIKLVIDQYMKRLLYKELVKDLRRNDSYRYSDIGNLKDIMNKRSIREHNTDSSVIVIPNDKKDTRYYDFIQKEFGSIDNERVSREVYDKLTSILKEIGLIEDIQLQGETKFCFVTPYLRFGLCEKLMKKLEEGYSKEFERYGTAIAGEALKGHMQEAVIYLELKHSESYYDFDMYKGTKEVDLIIKDNNTMEMDLYEIKHSSQIVPEQAKNLIDREFIQEAENVVGYKARKLCVIYNGDNAEIEIKPAELFEQLRNAAIQNNQMDLEKKYDKLMKEAQAQKWKVVTINYLNAEEFLLNI